MSRQRFHLLLIGAELLSGRRQDKHLAQVISTLEQHGHQLDSVQMVNDYQASIERALQHSLNLALPCLCFGGIGATPDDRTRQAAASAFGRPLTLHDGARQLIENQFGSEAYPNRILMAELPQACALIPNPYNQIPGFFLEQHYFLPGFPKMAWPMLEWLLDTQFGPGQQRYSQSLWLYEVRESQIVRLLQQHQSEHPELDQHCLPGHPPGSRIELGYSSEDEATLLEVMKSLEQALREQGFQPLPHQRPIQSNN